MSIALTTLAEAKPRSASSPQCSASVRMWKEISPARWCAYARAASTSGTQPAAGGSAGAAAGSASSSAMATSVARIAAAYAASARHGREGKLLLHRLDHVVGARLAQRLGVEVPRRHADRRAADRVGGLDVERRVADDEDLRVGHVGAEERLAARD